MEHFILAVLLCWALLSLPLCVMIGRMFTVASDAQGGPGSEGDERHSEFFESLAKTRPVLSRMSRFQ
jgi:hypothetical protein